MGLSLLITVDVAMTIGVTAKAVAAVRRRVEQIGACRPDWSRTVGQQRSTTTALEFGDRSRVVRRRRRRGA
jgi:hypothetical protein